MRDPVSQVRNRCCGATSGMARPPVSRASPMGCSRALNSSVLNPVSCAQPLLRSDLRNGTAAGLARVPDALQQGIQFIRFDAPTLAPMAFTRFCLKYPDDCEQQQLFGDDRIELNKMRWSELENINRIVNSSIHPERNEDGLAGEK
jgi:hypothetical protein